MRLKSFRLLTIIIRNINWSTNFVQFERFKRERCEVIDRATDNNNDVDSDSDLDSDQECTICSECEDRRDKKCSNREEDSKHGKGLINDLIWLLECNQNGLMQLLLYFLHLLLLAIQVFISFSYSSFPTTRDPTTNEFTSPWLRYSEMMALNDPIHGFDSRGRYNRLLGLVACQCLILRVSAFLSRLKTSKANRYRYKEINIVDIEFGYASEIRCSYMDTLRSFFQLLNHECFIATSLSGANRRETLEFNSKVRCLSKMDRIYYYNQIDFNRCFAKTEMFTDYHKLIENIDINKSEGYQYGNGCLSPNLKWYQFVFRFNLPNKVNFVALPEHRLEFIYGMVMYYIFLIGTGFSVFIIVFLNAAISYLAITNSNGMPLVSLLLCLLRTYLTVTLIVFNIYDSALLAYCSAVFLARSKQAVKLLENEIQVYRYHLRRLLIINECDQSFSNFKTKFLCLPSFSTGFKKRFTDIEKQTKEEKSFFYENYGQFSFMREPASMNAEKSIDNYVKRDRIADLISTYMKSLHQSSVVTHFNENMSYLLDLIEVIQFELGDHKRFFTLQLDVYIIFGTLGSSIALGLILDGVSKLCGYVAALALIAFLVPMLFALTIGACSEAAVSIATDRPISMRES